MAKEVRRDMHKMHAFVRFREVEAEGSTRYVAWFEPEHHIVRSNAGFFVAASPHELVDPDAELSIHWDGETLTRGPGATARMRRTAIRSRRRGRPIIPRSSILPG
jgi:DNA polymerase